MTLSEQRMSTKTLTRWDLPSAWTKQDIENDQSWIYNLSADEIEEIDLALRKCQEERIPVKSITKSNFALPKMQSALKRIANDIKL